MELDLKKTHDVDLKQKQQVNPATSNLIELPSGSWKDLLDYVSSNPEEIESVIDEGQEEGSSGLQAPFSLIQEQLSQTEESEGEGYILDLPITGGSGSLEQITEPQARYRQAEEVYLKPDISFDQRLEWEPSLDQIEIPSKYENASRFLNSVKTSTRWAMDALKEIYMTVREEQHRFINTLDSQNFRPFTMTDCADEVGIDESTASRLVRGESLEIYTGDESYRMPLKEIFTSYDNVRKFRAVDEINEVLQMEYEDRTALSDNDIADAVNMDISRKTVQKYRSENDVPASRQREADYADRESPYQIDEDLDIWEV